MDSSLGPAMWLDGLPGFAPAAPLDLLAAELALGDQLAAAGPAAANRPGKRRRAPAGAGGAAPAELLDVADPATIRRLLREKTLEAVASFPPVKTPTHQLLVQDVAYEGPDDFSLEDQKQAILRGRTLLQRLRGTLVLRAADGSELDRKRLTLARIPWVTDRGTFILNGDEHVLRHQLRLLPGVYTRRQANGQLEAHVNVAKGLGHRIFLDPETGIFRLRIGQAQIPLTALLRSQGVTLRQLQEAWGPELAQANWQQTDRQAIKRLYSKLYRFGPEVPPEEMPAAVAKAFEEMTLDPEVTRRTLGVPYERMGPDTVLAVTRKLLNISRGEAEPDDRDAMPYQRVVGPAEVIAERLAASHRLLNKVLWRAAARGNLEKVQAAVLDPAVEAAVRGSNLLQNLEEVNPGEVFDSLARVTRLGRGGITSSDAVPEESRNVQPTQLGFLDLLRTPESGQRVGVDLVLAQAVKKDRHGRLYAPVVNTRTGRLEYHSAQDLADKVLGFPRTPDEAPDERIPALVAGQLRRAWPHEIDFRLPNYESAYSTISNLVPFKSGDKGQRAVMAARMLLQALPLVQPESPWVQSGIPGQPGKSFEEHYSDRFGALRATKRGRVLDVSPTEIRVRYEDGSRASLPLYQSFPFNRKTRLHQTPVVEPGHRFAPGDVLARSNYTDDRGTVALGRNARTGYISWDGLNFEDAVVISQSFADKLTSEQTYQHRYDWNQTPHRGKRAFIALFPGKFPAAVMDKLDENGVVRPGTVVQPGEPLILAARPRDRNYKSVVRTAGLVRDESVLWEHSTPGTVADVSVDDAGATVTVVTHTPAQEGDKLADRHAAKGVIARIIPDDQMPVAADGKPLEVLLNPVSVITRVNAAQIVEAALGKVAALRGKPYKLPDDRSVGALVDFARKELKKYRVSDKETVTDPRTGRKIPDILVGNRWFMKLHHQAEAKGQGRGAGEGYTSEGLPSKGGYSGAKRLGLMETNALLSHGATEVLRSAKLVRGQANAQWWAQYQAGFNPPTPKVPLVYTKFLEQLRAAGLNPVRRNRRVHLMALTNDDIRTLTEDRELQNAETVDWKTMEPVTGGLFDKRLTGGHASLDGGGNRWSFIRLPEPLPSPAMEEPIRRLLGLSRPQFEEVLAGKRELAGRTGPRAIQSALEELDLDREIARARADIASGKRSFRDDAVRRLGYLKSAKALGIHPKQWIWDRVPVLPPLFRPVSLLKQSDQQLVDDANLLYKELFQATEVLRDLSQALPENELGENRLAVYRALKAVTGLGAPTHPKNVERRVRGILQHVMGSSPKFSVMQRKLLATPVDLVGRATIIPDPDLAMDEVGLPEELAWDIYRPLVIRRLVRNGWARLPALNAVKNRADVARAALLKELDEGVVLINRAPTLHRFGILAARPRIVTGFNLRIPPLLVGGFNADFDGDAMQFHALVLPDEKKEALEKLLPSRNLLSVGSFEPQHTPRQEYVAGLYEASTRRDGKQPPRVFATPEDVLRAYRREGISVGHRVILPLKRNSS